MATHDNTYSRIIAWLKILLPLLALAVLSTLFLVARSVAPAQDLPFADIDVDELAEQQRIGNPNFSGVTEDGTAISLSADNALPHPTDPNKLSGSKVLASIDLPNGERLDVRSTVIKLNYAAKSVTLNEGVLLTTSGGYEMTTASLVVALDATSVVSDSPMLVSGPIGQLSADSFRLSSADKVEDSYVLVFKGNVKLIYNGNE